MPHFRAGDWAGGIEAGVDGIIAATKGEYTAPPPKKAGGLSPLAVVLVILFLLLFLWLASQGSRQLYGGRTYDRRGWRRGGDRVSRAAAGAAAGRGAAEAEAAEAAAAEASPAAAARSAAAARRAAGRGHAMRHEAFLDALDDARVVAAIREAESRCRAEIRVHVTDEPVADVEAAAAITFEKLGMTQTAERNGVLIYVAPETQRFAVLGDAGIHGASEPGFWSAVTATMQPLFREGRFTDGVVAGVLAVGTQLARVFPRREGDTDRNELSDAVSRD